jgi:hypothetical protein
VTDSQQVSLEMANIAHYSGASPLHDSVIDSTKADHAYRSRFKTCPKCKQEVLWLVRSPTSRALVCEDCLDEEDLC